MQWEEKTNDYPDDDDDHARKIPENQNFYLLKKEWKKNYKKEKLCNK